MIVHMGVWGLVFGTDLRFDGPEPVVVKHTPSAEEAANPHLIVQPTAEKTGPDKPAEMPRRISKWDRVFAASVELSGGAGKLALLLLMPLVGMGVLLGAGSATQGVEKSVSAFAWAVGVGLLALPLGRMLGLAWEEGALASYATIIEGVESQSVASLAVHLMLPATCIVALALVGLKFSDATEAALLMPEHHFDQTLEKEASNVKAGSLIGGRGAAALSIALKQDGTPKSAAALAVPSAKHATKPAGTPRVDDDGLPRIGQVTSGEAPRRLI
jgi:hypothetical protein